MLCRERSISGLRAGIKIPVGLRNAPAGAVTVPGPHGGCHNAICRKAQRRPGSWPPYCGAGFHIKAIPHNSRLTAQAPLRRLRHGICVAKMLDKTSSIICAFGLASAAPRSPYRHLELCGIAQIYDMQQGKGPWDDASIVPYKRLSWFAASHGGVGCPRPTGVYAFFNV